METFDARLRSFVKGKSKSSGKWTHPDSFIATPTSLAEAGFYFKPSKQDPDNVQCFICKKELSGWEEDDNPFEIHVKKCPKCPWAIARCSLEFDVDSDGKFLITDSSRLPTNKVLEKARADTFKGGKKWWPHDSVKNHGAASKKMAKAGFVYTPQKEGDDTATCFYCDLSLSGWDESDDPTEEHVKRVEKSGKPCPFFNATERPKSQASTRSTKNTSRQSRAPKQIDAESDTIDDDDDEPPTVKAPVRRGKQKSSAAAPSSTATARPDKSSKLSEAENTDELEEDDDPSLKVNSNPAPRKSTRKPALKSRPTSRSTGRGKQRVPSASDEESSAEVETKRARSRTKSAKSTSTKEGREVGREEHDKPPSNVDGKITKQYEDFVVDINELEEKNKGEKKRRGRPPSKSKSRSTSARASSVANPNEKPLARARSRSRISVTTEMADERETEQMLAEPPSETEAEQEPEPESKRTMEKKPSSKARRQTRAKKAPAESELDELEQETSATTSKPASVRSEKSRSGKSSESSRTSVKPSSAKSRTKASDPSSLKEGELTGPTGDSEEQDEHTIILHDADGRAAADDNRQMDIDLDIAAEKPSTSTPVQHSFPNPESPSDFKLAPSKTAKSGKANSKPNPDTANRSEDVNGPLNHQRSRTPSPVPTHAHQKESKKQKPVSTKSKSGVKASSSSRERTNSEYVERDVNDMDVDDEGIKPVDFTSKKTSSSRRSTDASTTRRPPAPEVTDAPPSRPTTPEAQIMRSIPPKQADNAIDFQTSLRVPPSPADMFLPPLADKPIQTLTALTEEERAMTVEQWIRHEMAVQYQRLKEDGERRIQAFLEKAEETKRQIEAL
ncbi:uncharacterized protein FOMMEDRAFT_165810 [Fomitiporia mediterranea MF3/22]|uniref:uncharacterized protein n=1 Tax=Fomitiporia mediterranea (strain MF3/22) TaxID=694068 RepID=UPI000440807B|nr:uncharacterized protein FOMMEDRAFT_165810 [Fomitiporia mediterranea MF3/22]EJD05359.1 hypothetical protein FOMMEDRAFT_165810 [Fomitiporia mediterranea MF3/22]